MAVKLTKLEELIKNSFPDAQVTVKDLAGDDNHYAVHIMSEQFRGKPRIVQHKMVYKALGGVDVHALQIKTWYEDIGDDC